MLKRIKDSLNARLVIPWTIKHFEKTKYGKTIACYKNKHCGQRCFLIGNGPSLKAEDLSLLKRNNEITFGFNRIYNIFDQTEWRPTYYISQDEKMLGGCIAEVNGLTLPVKMIPIQLKWFHDISIKDALYFNMKGTTEGDLPFSDNCSHELYNSATCMYTAAQFAVYMGFSEIYLLGVDHQFRISQNNSGKIVVDESVKDYFTDKYNEDREKLYIPNTENSTNTYIAMREQCERRNVTVYNATRGGKLEVFSRKSFDELFFDEEKNV